MGERAGKRRWMAVGSAMVVAASVLVTAPAAPQAPPADVPGTGAAFPRVVYDPGTEATLRYRVSREPLRTVFLNMDARASSWDDRTLGDPAINAQRDLTRAAKVRAFQYAIDRTVIGGEVAPFASAADRQAAGDFARDVLLQVYDRSRLAVPPPIGGWDRDISTSEEIVNAVETLDLLLGSGYDLGADRPVIVGRIQRVTEELHLNFVDPDSASGYTRLHQNNHRTKSGAAMALAAIVLADDIDADKARRWFDTGVGYVDDSLRYILMTGDGVYAEGTHYDSFTLQNVLPFVNAWERLLGAASWTTADGLVVPALAHHPLFARNQRWMVDITLPNGALAPIDDANVGRSSYLGALPSTIPSDILSAGRWRWANQTQPYFTDGNVELGPDAIAAYDDTVAPARPTWAPTQFYVEGGNAMFRSSWDADATMALVLGEHDTASQFGRDRDGVGRWPQSHEHAEPGSFLLHAFGEDLALDPGYLSFTTHGLVNRPEHHNVVLVDGQGPADYLNASIAWGDDPMGRPPAEGQSTIADTLDTSAADVATVVSDYRGAAVERRFLFGGDRYLVVSDQVNAYGAPGATLTWPVHGNGGETSGGTYDQGTSGGTWTYGGARLTSAIAVPGATPALTTRAGTHERPGNIQTLHTVLDASAPAAQGGAVQVLYPSRIGDTAPTVETSSGAATPWVRVTAPSDDRILTVTRPAPEATEEPTAPARAAIDGATGGRGLLSVDRRSDGTLRSAWADDATDLSAAGGPAVHVDSPGSLGLTLDPTDPQRVEVVATGSSGRITVTGLGFTPTAADGACGFEVDLSTGAVTVDVGRERRVVLRTGSPDVRPAADAGAVGRVTPGSTVRLDGSASCDGDGGTLSHRWELVSAPAGSAWSLTGATTASPSLLADVVGPYRVRLVVTDDEGNRSAEQEVLVVAGPRCGDGIDNDLDGRIDTDDIDCDGVDPAPPETTTTTTSTTTTLSPTSNPTTTTVPGPTVPGALPAEARRGSARYTG